MKRTLLLAAVLMIAPVAVKAGGSITTGNLNEVESKYSRAFSGCEFGVFGSMAYNGISGDYSFERRGRKNKTRTVADSFDYNEQAFGGGIQTTCRTYIAKRTTIGVEAWYEVLGGSGLDLLGMNYDINDTFGIGAKLGYHTSHFSLLEVGGGVAYAKREGSLVDELNLSDDVTLYYAKIGYSHKFGSSRKWAINFSALATVEAESESISYDGMSLSFDDAQGKFRIGLSRSLY